MEDTPQRMMARVRTMLDFWQLDECEVIEWLMKENETIGAVPEVLIERLDPTVEAWVVTTLPMRLWVQA